MDVINVIARFCVKNQLLVIFCYLDEFDHGLDFGLNFIFAFFVMQWTNQTIFLIFCFNVLSMYGIKMGL
jgi:hypothetical protein